MTQSLKKVFLIFFCMIGLSLAGFSADISGTWAMTNSTPDGEMEADMTIEQDGEKIKVTMEGEITLDKDFGAGYQYDIIMENASRK